MVYAARLVHTGGTHDLNDSESLETPGERFVFVSEADSGGIARLVGKREERFSLGTREPAEDKRRHAVKAAEVQQRWANLRLGLQKMGWDEAVQLGSTVAAQWSQQLAADPHQSLFWDTTVGALLWKGSPNRSWRHRIKTQGRRHRIASDLLDAMTVVDGRRWRICERR
jgi:hypothetical protein